MRGPATTESGPVPRQTVRRCKSLDRTKHSHKKWTSRRGPLTSVETWTYDPAARPATSVTPAGTSTYTWDKASNLLTSALPNGTVETQTWDRANNLAAIATTKGAATLVRHTVTRDNAGNPTQTVLNRGTASETRSYRYDPNDRLQGVCYTALTSCTGAAAATQWWTYDLAGNRLTEKNGTGTGTTTTYTYNDADQLTSRKTGTSAAVPSTYDADGNLLTEGTTTWAYDLNNRAISSKIGSAAATAWQRDAAGNLLKQTAGTVITTYDWDLNNPIPQLAAVTSGTTTTSHRYDPAGRAATLTQAGVTQSIAHDPIGSVTDLLTAAGAIARSYDYTPFGTTRTAVGAPSKPIGATSRLQYAGMLTSSVGTTYATPNRTYDPTTARWTGTDPVSAPMSMPFASPYTYAANRPVLLTDPLGLWPSLQQVSDFSAGFGDVVSFGATAWARGELGAGDVVDRSSGSYGFGTATGVVAGSVTLGAGAAATVARTSLTGIRATAGTAALTGIAEGGATLAYQQGNGYCIDYSQAATNGLLAATGVGAAAAVGRGVRTALTARAGARAAQTTPVTSGYGVGATPKRVAGPWTVSDLKQGAFGRPPRSLGRPDLHHADQMPGSGIHEVPPNMHRGNSQLHPNGNRNQGVTQDMRREDRNLHWWYRSQEMGGWDELGPGYYYDNLPG